MIVLLRKDPSTSGPELTSMVDQSASRLMSLPPELRNQIWGELLIYCAYNDTGRSNDLISGVTPTWFSANILKTCKQANSEGTPILYGENTFTAHPSLLTALPSFRLLSWLDRISLPPVTCPRVGTMIRRYYIHVRLDTDPRFSKSQVEESFTRVEYLEIEVFQAMYGSCDLNILKLFEGVRGVGRAIVQGSVGDGKYASWLARCIESPVGTEVPAYMEKWVGGEHAWDSWTHGNR